MISPSWAWRGPNLIVRAVEMNPAPERGIPSAISQVRFILRLGNGAGLVVVELVRGEGASLAPYFRGFSRQCRIR